jgi:tripartite-type tricarboxylate transporter receptor subunit TctC
MIRIVAAALATSLVGTACLDGASPAQAEPWPQRSVRIIMTQPSGTGADLTARLFAERLAQRWGQPVVVENRPGGDGMAGVTAFAAMRDDHTLLFSVSAPFSVQPVIQDKLPYDPDRDAVPISIASDILLAVAAAEPLNVTTLTELERHARANPGKLNWTAGPGLPRYVFAAFAKRTGLEMTHVSYRELAPALQDLGSGRLHVIVHGLSVIRPQVDAGRVRLLAVTNRARAAISPDTPTTVEAGFAELAMDGFGGFFGWRGMSDDLRDRIAADVRAVGSDPELAARLLPTGQIVRTSTPIEFADALAGQRARITDIVRVIGSSQ